MQFVYFMFNFSLPECQFWFLAFAALPVRAVARYAVAALPASRNRGWRGHQRDAALTVSDRPVPGAVALVTGSSRRVGQALAFRLADQGFALALHSSARSSAEATATAAAIMARGGQASVFVADLADAQAVAMLMPQVAARMGPVHVLVNNASLFAADAAGQADIPVFDAHMAVNLRAPVQLAAALAAQLPDDAQGAIINIVDQRVWRLNPQYFSYTLSKAALWTATQTMAQAFAPRIRVNAIGPGPVLANGAQKAEAFAREARAVLLQHAVALEAIADAMAYLLQARSVTGQMIAVDGGQHLAWQTPDVLAGGG